jgi:hypothetical protein
MHKHPSVERVVVISGTIIVEYGGSNTKTLGPVRIQKFLRILITLCSAVGSLNACFYHIVGSVQNHTEHTRPKVTLYPWRLT